MRFLKKIWRKIRGLFIKRPPSTEEIISEEKAVLTQTIVKEEIYIQIKESIDENKKSELLNLINSLETFSSIKIST